MPLPNSREARRFYRVAYQRMDDAESLLRDGRNSAAVYLAGYGVECILKALLLNGVPEREHAKILKGFRGTRGHDFESLKAECTKRTGVLFPTSVGRPLTKVNKWTTEMRYHPGTTKKQDTVAFLQAAKAIL